MTTQKRVALENKKPEIERYWSEGSISGLLLSRAAYITNRTEKFNWAVLKPTQ